MNWFWIEDSGASQGCNSKSSLLNPPISITVCFLMPSSKRPNYIKYILIRGNYEYWIYITRNQFLVCKFCNLAVIYHSNPSIRHLYLDSVKLMCVEATLNWPFLSLCDSRMMEADIGDHSVLLTRCNGKYSAIGNQCTHYGAPLSKGRKTCVSQKKWWTYSPNLMRISGFSHVYEPIQCKYT